MTARAPFPWFGGKSRVAHLVWERFGDTPNYVEPFAGSLAVLLARPHPPRVETVNDIDCVAPETRILRADLTWAPAGEIAVGDQLVGFDEENGPARGGLRAPTRYRRLARATATGVRRLTKPCYRLIFDDDTLVVASADHQWLGGSHRTGGRGWRWLTTKNMVCDRRDQRSWVLKVADVVETEDSHEAGWLGGLLDGEGTLKAGPGLRVTFSQNPGPTLDRAKRLLAERAFGFSVSWPVRRCLQVQMRGGLRSTLALLMRVRPERLIQKLADNLDRLSLYGREHRAVGLVSKEFLGDREVVAIETSSHTFIAEGLASHNCYLANFWRAIAADPEATAAAADWPVNEADLHARHRWLVDQLEFRERMKSDPDYYDAKVAGWWVWGLSQWIGSGWCSQPEWTGRAGGHSCARGINTAGWAVRPAAQAMGINRKRPNLGGHNDKGVHRRSLSQQLPDISGDAGAAGRGVHASALVHRKRPKAGRHTGLGNLARKTPKADRGTASRLALRRAALVDWFEALQERLRTVRVCCGDWKRILGPSPTIHIGTTAVFLDPPYDPAEIARGAKGDGFSRSDRLYSQHDAGLSAEVRLWALEHGDDRRLRIALCGYEGEHDMPEGWEVVAWKAAGGYSNRSGSPMRNAGRERIWFSPHCLLPARAQHNLDFTDSPGAPPRQS